MPKRIIFTANMPLVAEDMNKLLQDNQIVQENNKAQIMHRYLLHFL